MILCLGYYERQARSERNKVQKGMTVDEVLPLVHGACGIRTHAVLPDNVSDEEGVHYASLLEHEDGTFGWSSGPDYRSRQLTEDEAAGLMKQKMVGRLRLALAIHLHQRYPTALLLHCDIRARRTCEGRHRRLGMGLIRARGCRGVAGGPLPPDTTWLSNSLLPLTNSPKLTYLCLSPVLA
jgi:hypothetical protein